ncbi:MAG: hypothetical protein AAF974_03000 [Cyanobacteria bacterium P01_E01_bin.34]
MGKYNRAYRQIEADGYRPNRVLVWVVAIVVLLLGVIGLPFALWRAAASKPTPPEPPALLAPEEN